jgi:hypothetical protein
MTKCNIFNCGVKKYVLFENKRKGFKMKIIVKNVETLLEKFENSLEKWADILF